MITSLVMSEPSKTKPLGSLLMLGLQKKVTKRVHCSRCGKVGKPLKMKKIPPSQQGKVAKKGPQEQLVIKVLHKGKG